ncbi:MAG: SDR family oxidoreductase [Acidimicrobiia bacterium]|nr:SDR family oxidoreductase [Acidimicrobiia bacterium]
MQILVTGATSYLGGRLVPRLLDAGHEVRCLTRQMSRIEGYRWRDRVTTVQGSMLDLEALEVAHEGCDIVYNFARPMSIGRGADTDSISAINMRDASTRAGVRRVIYLSGLGSAADGISPYLALRHEMGHILRSGDTPVTEVQTSAVIGSGSITFEMIRYLSEVLPIMVTPSWTQTPTQPIAIRNVLEVLTGIIEVADEGDRIIELGGPEVLTYEQMMRIYAQEAGLTDRRIVRFPPVGAALSAWWVALVTPLPMTITRTLIDSLGDQAIVRQDTIRSLLPGFDPFTYQEAVRLALYRTSHLEVETRWSDAVMFPAAALPSDPQWTGAKVYTDERQVVTHATSADLFGAFTRIGGDVGYYSAGWAWHIRGWLDQLMGGFGLRRNRRHPAELRTGEALDFWRVAAMEKDRHLLLRAEMKVPGEAWLEWNITDDEESRTLTQVARFYPRGLAGRLYWYAMKPAHGLIFGPMVKRIAKQAGRAK